MSGKRKINFTILYYLGSLVVLIILNGFLIYISNQKVAKVSVKKAAIQIIETNLDGIESGVLRGFDAGLRGYAIVRHEELLHPYTYAFDLSDHIFRILHQEVDHFEYDRTKITDLQAGINQYGTYMKGLKKLVDENQMNEFSQELAKNMGNAAWEAYNQVRVDFKGYLNEQVRLMDGEIASFQQYTYLIQLVSIGLALLILILIYGKIVSFAQEKNAYIDQIELANEKLAVSGALLKQEVEHKTTDLRKANEELKETLEEVRTMQSYMLQSEKMTSLGTMTAGINHEFNNALNHIIGGVQIMSKTLEEPYELPEKEDCVVAKNILDEGISRIGKIVNSLQVFSERSETVALNTDIHDLIENSIIILKPKLDQNIELVKKLELPRELLVKRAEIQQVIVQLIDNAIYAVKSQHDLLQKRIEIVTKQQDQKALIEVCNNGALIPEERLRELFDPFYTTKNPGYGTGLGLSICYSVVNRHNGTIVARNENDMVKFLVELPLNEKGAPNRSTLIPT